VATMVIAKWQGERDEERFQEVLRNPAIVDREVERAMLGADDETEDRPGRFEREELVVPTTR